MKGTLRQTGWALLLALLGGAALTVMVVMAATLTPPYVIAVRDTGENSHPARVAVDPGGYAYVLDQLGKVWIFSGTEITGSLNINASDIGVDPGRYVYLTSRVSANPVRVLSGKELVGTVDLEAAAGAVAVLTTTEIAYVALPDVGEVARLGGAEELEPRITVGITPTAIAANPTTGYVYVANRGSDSVSVIQDAEVVATLEVDAQPSAIAINPVDGYVYVANSYSGTVSVLEGTALVTTLNVGVAPSDIAINTRTGLAYVVNGGSIADPGSLTVIEPGTWVTTSTDVGDYPRAVAVNSHSGYIYVVGGQGSAGTVSVLSETLVIETFLPVGHTPRDVAVDPVQDLGYVPLYKAGMQNVGRVVILGRTEASTVVVPPDGTEETVLACEGVAGLPVTVRVPPQAVAETITLLCSPWEPDPGPDYLFAGQGFLLKAYRYGVHQPGFEFASPITLEMVYPSPLPGGGAEDELLLISGDPSSGWREEGLTLAARHPALDRIDYTLTMLPDLAQSGYALVTPRRGVYLPLVLRSRQ